MGAIPTQHSLHISHCQQDAVLQQKLGQSPPWAQAGDSAGWWQEELEAWAGCCFSPSGAGLMQVCSTREPGYRRGWSLVSAGGQRGMPVTGGPAFC